jgi:cellulose synthase/poly-beta-1,6-N-acetylglucosamine synthase-like glycosyltransferase
MFGWFKRKEIRSDKFKPVKKFAIMIAAHNEEMVIGNIVRNMLSLDYPKELYDIIVIADNCTDGTAEIARMNGAEVFERFDKVKRGKGFALEWAFAKLFKMDRGYDAVSVFDADNLVSANFLKEMNMHLCRGHKVIQGYLDSKNPNDTIISGSYSITYWINNRLFQLARYYAGLSCAIGGTGFVVAADVLKDIGWGATCLTEDLEFTMKLALKGMKVHWSHEVAVYDEKPLTMQQSWKQRKRWMQGQSDCMIRYFPALISKAIKDKSLVVFDCAMYLIQPMIIVFGGVGLLANLMKFLLFFDFGTIQQSHNIMAIILMLLTTYFSIIFIIAEGKLKSVKVLLYYIVFPFWNLTWIPIIIQGFLHRNNTEWSHTLHTRAMDLKDIAKLERV